MAAKPLPSQEDLRQLLDYDEELGVLRWRPRTSSLMRTKEQAVTNQWNSRCAGREAFTFSDRKGYRHGKILGTKYQAHRIIWKMVYGVDPEAIDHINGDPSDNRLANLRACTPTENSRNYAKTATGSSTYRGVCWVVRDRKWAARISNGAGGKISLGNFHNEVEAAEAYDDAAKKFHGQFATLNFPGRRILSALDLPSPPTGD